MSEPGRLKVGFRQYKGLIWTIGEIVYGQEWKVQANTL